VRTAETQTSRHPVGYSAGRPAAPNRRFRIIGVDAEERVEIVYGVLNIDGARVEVREGVVDVG
jgi:hypothetical protein